MDSKGVKLRDVGEKNVAKIVSLQARNKKIDADMISIIIRPLVERGCPTNAQAAHWDGAALRSLRRSGDGCSDSQGNPKQNDNRLRGKTKTICCWELSDRRAHGYSRCRPPEMHQLLRLVSLQIGQQIHLTSLRYHLWRDIWHMFHLHSDIKIAEGFSE